MAPGTCNGGARPGMGAMGHEIRHCPADPLVRVGADAVKRVVVRGHQHKVAKIGSASIAYRRNAVTYEARRTAAS
jgi:hypothetical protein